MADTDNVQALKDRAYHIWEQEGRPDGRADEHWARAVHELGRSGGDRGAGGAKEAGRQDERPQAAIAGNARRLMHDGP